MSNYVLNAEKRTSKGSNAVRKLRTENIVPGQLYQRDKENISVQVIEKDLDKIMEEAGQSAIIQLMVDGEEHNVLIRDYQKHPFKNQYLHVDFLGVNMDEELRVTVPIVLLNRDSIYVQPSVLLQHIEEVEIMTLPKYIPHQIEIDVQEMQIGDSILVNEVEQLKDENIEVLTDLEEVVCTLSEPEEVDLDEEVEQVDADSVEVIGEEDDEEETEEE